jgi:hypothetical protein
MPKVEITIAFAAVLKEPRAANGMSQKNWPKKQTSILRTLTYWSVHCAIQV